MNCRRILCLCALFAGVVLCAEEIDLNMNGKFRGAAKDAETAPGWIPDNAIGSCRILKGRKSREFVQEIAATTAVKSVSSEFYPATGSRLKVDLKYSGSGNGKVSCFCYDSQRQQIAPEESAAITAAETLQEREFRFVLPPRTAFIRLVLAALPKSTVCFEDVNAEYMLDRAPAGAPQVSVDIYKGKVSLVTESSAHVEIPPEAVPLANDKRLYYKNIPYSGVYRGETTLGNDFDVDLGEDSNSGIFWQVMSYDPNVCLVKIDHKHLGFGAFNLDKAVIEILPYSRGSVRVDLSCGRKKMTIYVTAR